jgi:hypothetical protein
MTLSEMTFDDMVLPSVRVAVALRVCAPASRLATEKPFGEEEVWPPIQKGELVSVVLSTPSTKYETVAVVGIPVDETKMDSATVAGLNRPLRVKPAFPEGGGGVGVGVGVGVGSGAG